MNCERPGRQYSASCQFQRIRSHSLRAMGFVACEDGAKLDVRTARARLVRKRSGVRCFAIILQNRGFCSVSSVQERLPTKTSRCNAAQFGAKTSRDMPESSYQHGACVT